MLPQTPFAPVPGDHRMRPPWKSWARPPRTVYSAPTGLPSGPRWPPSASQRAATASVDAVPVPALGVALGVALGPA